MIKLTRRQAEVLEHIRMCIRTYGWPPTRSEIAAHFQWASANAAEDHLKALEHKGAISLAKGKARGIQLL